MGGLHSPFPLAIRLAPVHFMLSKSLSIIKLAGAAGMGIFRAGGRGYGGVRGTFLCRPGHRKESGSLFAAGQHFGVRVQGH